MYLKELSADGIREELAVHTGIPGIPKEHDFHLVFHTVRLHSLHFTRLAIRLRKTDKPEQSARPLLDPLLHSLTAIRFRRLRRARAQRNTEEPRDERQDEVDSGSFHKSPLTALRTHFPSGQ